MMIDLLFAFLATLVVIALLVGAFKFQSPQTSGPPGIGMGFLFLFLLLAIWAGGVWIAPVGPPMLGGYWVPFVIVGLFLLFLLPALQPNRSEDIQAGGTSTSTEAKSTVAAFGVFFWVLLVILVAAIVMAYLIPPTPAPV